MSATGSVRGFIRHFGYTETPGLTVIAKESQKIDFYNELNVEPGVPAVFWRKKESRWLVTIDAEDFMDMYRAWEMERSNG